ncbi:Hsp20/alpha crystallin family protein [Caulobacter sp. 1776]|uniref:Hsp20/alpha crystallin family protein n=1 Tax=Caulobacter sp. 1776 TaxID=3156420 RepID=UPI0033988BC0
MSLHESKPFLPALSQQATHIFAPLQREIDRVFSEFGRSLGVAEAFSSPSLDFSETAQGVELKLDVPGYDQDELSITLDNDVLTVRGEKASETQSDDKTYRVFERRSGAFARQVPLPRTVDGDKFSATLKNGVLTITAPKTAGAPGRDIAIQTAKADPTV